MKHRPKLTAGRLLYLGYHLPLSLLRQSRREGGPLAQWITRRGRREMERAAAMLPPIAPAPAGAPVVTLMTGRRFWYQTAFCLWSLCRQAGRPIAARFIDDGTFDPALHAEARRVFPGCAVIGEDATEAQLDRFLPAERYPALRRRRVVYPNLRKLTDVHAGASGWQLVLDSDMLFFAPPTELLAWLENPARPIHMSDIHNAYGYSLPLLESLAGGAIPQHLNVGVCGLHSESVDWQRLEQWTRELEAREGTSYYLEQALVALMLAGSDAVRLPGTRYLLMPDLKECRQPSAVMHHYVDVSKSGYFRHAWRHQFPGTDERR